MPKFKNVAEEANFWDTHDATDYFSHDHPVTLDFSRTKRKKESILTVRLQPELKVRLNSVAQDMGTQSSTLARMWLVERLKSMRAI